MSTRWPPPPNRRGHSEDKRGLFVSIVQMNLVGNCYKCGGEFERKGASRVCSSCRRVRSDVRLLNPRLTFRERQVVDLVSLGKLNKEIAYHLHLREGTIKEYLNRIFRKLGASNRTELAVWAITHQIQGERVA